MNRLQKRCLLFSGAMHGLLLVILIGSSAFRSKPTMKELPVMTFIPSRILDQAGAGGGSPGAPAPMPPQAQKLPTPQPVQPVVKLTVPKPAPVPPQKVVRETPKPAPDPTPEPREEKPEAVREPSIVNEGHTKPKRTHVIHPNLTNLSEISPKTKRTKTKPVEQENSESASAQAASAAAAQRSEQRRLARVAESLLNQLAGNVKQSGAQGTVVDMPGQGGGEAFIGYETYIYNAYFHAWVTPDDVADKLATAGVQIVVARDGSIISAEIIKRSGEAGLDRSVERALRAVRELPPFPASAHDERRTFLLRFNLEAKEGSG